MVKEEPVNGGVPIYHLSEEEEGVTCPPGLTAALSYAAASGPYVEVRAKGKAGVFSPASLTH